MAVPIPSSLVRHLREGRCALFVGAGISAAAGLPGWTKLLGLLVAEVEAEDGASGASEELRRLIRLGKLLEVADHCRERLGERRYLEVLAEHLRGGAGALPELHRVITELPFSALVTTNYDKLLERAYTLYRGDLPKVVTGRERKNLGSLLFAGGFFILKAHGDIDDAASLVLTSRDYRDIIHANQAFNALFSALLMTRSILFIGYSLTDPDFRLLLDGQLSAFGENIPERYAVMSGVGSVESDVLKRAANIKVLPYAEGQHDELLAFLRSLKQRLAPAPSAEAAVSLGVQLAPQAVTRARAEPGAASEAPSQPGRGELLAAPIPGPAAAPLSGDQPSSGVLAPLDSSAVELELAIREGQLLATLRAGKQQFVQASEMAAWSLFGRSLPSLMAPLADTQAAGGRTLRKLSARLAAFLPLRELQAMNPASLLLNVARELADIPWELAMYSADKPLVLVLPVCRALIAETAAARGMPGVRQPARALIIGDPGASPSVRLPGAYAEAVEIERVYGGARGVSSTLLCRDEAGLDSVVDALGAAHYDIVHFAGHAWLDRHESYLAFNQDEYITASELRSLLSAKPPAVLFLNSHFTAFLPRGVQPPGVQQNGDMPPTSHIGFTGLAATTGVGAFIGCFASPSDNAAGSFGISVHRELLSGSTIADAVYAARLATAAAFPDDLSALQYVLSGHPGYCIVPRRR